MPVLRRLRAGIRPVDGWLALGFVLAVAVEAVLRDHDRHALLAGNLVGALTFGCLALRRSRPLLTVSLMTAFGTFGSLAQAALEPHASGDQVVPVFALLVVSYSLGAYATRRQLLWGAWQPTLLVLIVDLVQPSSESLLSAAVFITIFVSAAPIVAGRLVRGRSTLVRQLRAQAVQLELQRRAHIGAAVAGERLRMAQRFHETLVSGMTSLAARTAAGVGAEPDVARIEHDARELLSQTRKEVVALTEPVPEPDAVAPAPVPVAFGDAAQPWTVLAGAALCAGLLVETRTLHLHVPEPLAWLACIAVALPLALAWLRPLLFVAAMWVLVALFDVVVAPLDGSYTAIGLSFGPPFAVAALASRRPALVGLAVCIAAELVGFGPASVRDNGAVVVCAWIAGAILHERARLVEQLRANNELLDAQRTAAARHAVAEARLGVARELHDAVGHSLTVIALQAGAARRIRTSDPDRAAEVLRTIAGVAQDGLAELRRGFVPGERDEAGEPRTVDDLLATSRAAGLCIDARVEDVAGRLSPGARFAVYRVVQESLTNIIKHAPGAPARVTITDGGDGVEIVVANSATDVPVAATLGGHGLAGMRARVEACGGRISWSPCVDGGFEVHAWLPAELASR